MNLILHIGVEKTGSTSLQYFLLSNRMLLIKNGFYFPSDSDLIDQYKGNLIGLCLFVNSKRIFGLRRRASEDYKTLSIHDYQSRFESSLERTCNNAKRLNCHTIVMSNEHCSSRLDAEEIKALYLLFKKYFENIKILVYLRDQISACWSLYSTHIKSGGTMSYSPSSFLSPDHYYLDFMYNYWDLLNRWSNVFGLENIQSEIYIAVLAGVRYVGMSKTLIQQGSFCTASVQKPL